MAVLATVSSGDESPARFELLERETTIGRHPECTIVVDAGAVSRYHAKIMRRNDGFVVEDSGSRNGTFLNGKLLTAPQFLREGDHIRVSDIEFVFQGDEVPLFARDNRELTFEGTNFGIMMTDDENDTEQLSSPKIEFRSSGDGLKISATPEVKLEALSRIFANLSDALSMDEVLPNVLQSLFDIFPAADRGFVVIENAQGELVPRWVKTRSPQNETETVRISRTIIRNVMESQEAILSMDASEDSRFDSSQSIADFSIRSMMCAPLLDRDHKAFGALQIDSHQGRGQFHKEDTDVLAGIARQIGIVIKNAQLYEQTLQQKEVEQDLRHATEVQKAFLPQQAPPASGFHVSSYYQAANHIGGDYFDYVPLNNGRFAIVVADVVGHGVAAAMFMAKLAAETRFCLASELDVAKAVERLNDCMSDLHVERFITFLVMVIDPASDNVTIVNAGHMPPILRRARDGSITEPGAEESGMPIAIAEGLDYEAVDVPMVEGDIAVMYTDGINESMNNRDEEFTIERVRRLVSDGGDAQKVCDRIIDAVRKHVGETPPFDDMCLVVIERTSGARIELQSARETVRDGLLESTLRDTHSGTGREGTGDQVTTDHGPGDHGTDAAS